jgi:hypothetical protein
LHLACGHDWALNRNREPDSLSHGRSRSSSRAFA